MISVISGFDGVTSGMDIFTIFTEMGHPFEAIKAMRVSLLSYFIEDGVCSIIAVYIDISCLTWMKLGGKIGSNRLFLHRRYK